MQIGEGPAHPAFAQPQSVKEAKTLEEGTAKVHVQRAQENEKTEQQTQESSRLTGLGSAINVLA